MVSAPVAKNRRLLVVDDNPSIHDDFRKILSPADTGIAALDATETAVFGHPTSEVRQIAFDLDSASQGQEGVLLVQRAIEAGLPYAVAFVDVRMPPGWDGVETTRRIWELDPDVQIVLCTAYSDYSWGEMFEKLGPSDGLLILKKPFDAVEALQLAHALTEKWWLNRVSQYRVGELQDRVAERTGELQHANQALQTEVATHERTVAELREQTAFLQAQVNSSIDGILVVDEHGKKRLQNQRVAELLKIPPDIAADEDDAAQVRWFASMTTDPEQFAERVRFLFAHPNDVGRDEIELKDGTILDRYSSPVIGHDGKYYGRIWTFRDITARTRLEAQLFQSQKMETVGKLAGGVAHEFNSILTTIIGQSELLLGDLPMDSPLAKHATAISKAADRGATLTAQLLAYGRRAFLQPELLDLNRVLSSMETMIRHLMGRDVDVRIVPGGHLYTVKADAGQIEQVIMNMAINARDAMPSGGKLTLETANVRFDDEDAGRYRELAAGDYVMLAITDTGAGMSKTVQARAFEPFFTTKGVGEGTGLGLSTSYGIVKQSGGHISLYSEPDRGATFKTYLPRVDGQATLPIQRLDLPDPPHGTETILLVEDDAALRDMAATWLRRLGYTVVAAANGIEALSLDRWGDVEQIDLLFTDVVMPHMDGRELSERMRVLSPRTRVLFTSAYTANAIAHQDVLSKGAALLQKPFTPSALAHKLREVLDG